MKMIFKETNEKCVYTLMFHGVPVHSFTDADLENYCFQHPVSHYLSRLVSEAHHSAEFFFSDAFDIQVECSHKTLLLKGHRKERVTKHPVMMCVLNDLFLEHINSDIEEFNF